MTGYISPPSLNMSFYIDPPSLIQIADTANGSNYDEEPPDYHQFI